MVSSFRRLLVMASPLALLAACAGSQFARAANGVALPSNGTKAGPAPETLRVQMMSADEWAAAPSQKLTPICDTRAEPVSSDAANVMMVRKVIAAWAAKKKAEPLPDPKLNVHLTKPDPSSEVASIAFTCAGVDGATTSALEINGVSHAFDLAWAVVSSPLGEPEVSIEVLSLTESKLVFGDVQYSEKNASAVSGKNIVTDISAYVQASRDLDEPLVRNLAGKGSAPSFETLLFPKGRAEGFYFEVPTNNDPISNAYYAEVGRFRVSG